jgi:hypothetical protein
MIYARRLGFVPAVALLLAAISVHAQTDEKATSRGPIDSDIVATIAGQGLRMRSIPGTGGHIITSFPKGEKVAVASRTAWEDTIDGITAPWYEVGKGWAAGWCFGGYLSLPADKETPVSSIGRGSPLPAHSYFEKADGSKLGPLPYLNMAITGIEMPFDIPSRDGFKAHYDLLNNYLLLETDKPISGPIELRAVDPMGAAFRGKPTYRLHSGNDEGHLYSKPVIGFSFKPPASTYAGAWRFELLQAGRLLQRYVVSLPAAKATLSSTPRPDPFAYPGSVEARQGDTLFLFGCNEKPNTDLTVAFYRINYEKLEPFNMIPRSAGVIRVDEAGRFATKFTIGKDMPSGSYKLATGTGELAINLFDVYMYIP